MSKIAHYLQEHLAGEVITSDDVLEHFATDGSILSVRPSVVIYPRNENDVRKTARFTWQLAERGRIIPITARGSGTDRMGAALGSGVILAFPAHMNRIIELNSKNGQVTVDPGINYGKLQQSLITHGQFLPPFPASLEYSTVGGAVANNASGEKTFKYGDTLAYVKGLRVVLANGEVIKTGRLNKHDLNKKLGLATFEGEIYRAVDTLLEEQHKTAETIKRNVTKNTAGYNVQSIKNKDGFDLTPLFVGSQGTLGVITEITLETMPHIPETTLLVGMFEDIQQAHKALIELRALSSPPSAIEMVDKNVLELVSNINPNQLKEVVQQPFPKLILLVEFDDNERQQKRVAKRAARILEKYATGYRAAMTEDEQTQLWKLRQAVTTLITHVDNGLKALPIIEDGIVPLDKYADYLEGVYNMLESHNLVAGVWGHAGDGELHVQPHLDLSQVGGRQMLFKLMEEYYGLVTDLGGSTSASGGDGRLRAPFLKSVYGEEVYTLFQKIKQIFDPYGILNPGVKVNVTLDDIKPLLRHEYSVRWHDHLPRT